MPELFPIKASELIKILKKQGFYLKRQKGSHAFLEHPSGMCTVVPVHSREEISRGLLRKILQDINLSVEEFNKIR